MEDNVKHNLFPHRWVFSKSTRLNMWNIASKQDIYFASVQTYLELHNWLPTCNPSRNTSWGSVTWLCCVSKFLAEWCGMLKFGDLEHHWWGKLSQDKQQPWSESAHWTSSYIHFTFYVTNVLWNVKARQDVPSHRCLFVLEVLACSERWFPYTEWMVSSHLP